MIANLSRSRAARAVGLVAITLGLVLVPSTVGAASVQAGKVQVTAPNGSAITGGGSETPFAVTTPRGAACPGDSAHAYYHVWSYFVRKGISPTAVSFAHGGIPSQGFGIISDGAYYGAVQTERDTGAIVTLPVHAVWGRVTTKMLFPNGEPSTEWQTGIACADSNGVIRRYWNAELRFTASTSDSHGFTWTILDAAPSSKHSHTVRWVVGVLLVGVIALEIALVIKSRRDRRHAGVVQ